MISVAIVGSGFMGENHARAVSEHPSFTLNYVVDVDRARAETVATSFRAEPSLDHEAIAEEVDAAIVATPPPTHFDIAMDFLETGVHLLLEKPITDRLADSKRLVARAEKADVVDAVGFILRYDPPHTTVRSRIARGDLGDIVGARVKRAISTDPAADRSAQLHGHPVLYMNIHDIDLLHYSLDADVETVTAFERRGKLDDAGMNIPDATQALLRFETGTIAVLEGYGLLPGDHPDNIEASFELTGTDGVASVQTPGDAVNIHADRYERPDTRFWPVSNERLQGTVRMQLDHFAAAITKGAAMPATIEDGYRAHVVADAVQQSIAKGGSISVEY